MYTAVRIEKQSALKLVGFAYETFPRETMGRVYGTVWEKRTGDRFIVEDAIADQVAERYPSTVIVSEDCSNRLKFIVGEGIGGFHSHTPPPQKNGKKMYAVAGMSKSDERKLQEEYSDGIEIIVAINRLWRRVPLRLRNDDSCLTGCFVDNSNVYNFDISAHYLEHFQNGNTRTRRARLSVPVRELRQYFV